MEHRETAAARQDEVRTPVPISHRVPAHLARRFQQICLGVTAEVILPSGITPGEYGMLALIDDHPGLDQKHLAETLGIDPVSAGQMIDRLEATDNVERRVAVGDRRARLLSATPKGKALRDHIRPAALAAQERIMAPLSDPERDAFFDMLTRIIEHNQTYARPGNGRRPPVSRSMDPRNGHDQA